MKERAADWAKRFGEGGLGLNVVTLTGETQADLKLLEKVGWHFLYRLLSMPLLTFFATNVLHWKLLMFIDFIILCACYGA